jgi:predicted membrane protein
VNGGDQFDPKKFSDDLHAQIHRDVHAGLQERMRAAGSRSRRRQGMLPGLLLVVIGSVILLDHMGIIGFDRVWRFWPLLLIAAGALKFFRECDRVVGALLMFTGGIFLLNSLGYAHLSWGDIWPIALIVLGVALVWSRFEMPRLPATTAGSGGPNVINEFAMFGGVERRINSTSFTGGTVTAMFGGVELDFRSAEIEGDEAIIIVEAIFGGIEVVVPERWTVVYEGQSIFGGYGDETRPPLPEVPGAAPKKRLVLRGRAVFGGISVKN